MRKLAAGVMLAVSALAVAGCGGRAPSLDSRVHSYLRELGRGERAVGHHEAAEVLSDGSLSDDEVDAMFAGFRECMGSAGQEVVRPTRSPIDGRTWLYDIGNLDELDASDSEANYQCVTRFSMDAAIAQAPGRMDEPLRASIELCLEQRGIDVSGRDRDLRSLTQRVGSRGADDLRTCIHAGMAELHPTLGYGLLLPEVL